MTRRQKFTKGWLNLWLYVILLISGIVLGVTAQNWHHWDLGTKAYALGTALLPIHVMEEWKFPGGFHTMYNMMNQSNDVSRYPMNQLSDMWTNFIGVIFGCIVLLVGVNPVFLIIQLFICFAEMMGHLVAGSVFVRKTFGPYGKKPLYNPGQFTTIFGYIPDAVLIIIALVTTSHPAVWQILIGIVCAFALGSFSLDGIEKICRDENSPYAYDWGNGYFEKWLKIKAEADAKTAE